MGTHYVTVLTDSQVHLQQLAIIIVNGTTQTQNLSTCGKTIWIVDKTLAHMHCNELTKFNNHSSELKVNVNAMVRVSLRLHPSVDTGNVSVFI